MRSLSILLLPLLTTAAAAELPGFEEIACGQAAAPIRVASDQLDGALARFRAAYGQNDEEARADGAILVEIRDWVASHPVWTSTGGLASRNDLDAKISFPRERRSTDGKAAAIAQLPGPVLAAVHRTLQLDYHAAYHGTFPREGERVHFDPARNYWYRRAVDASRRGTLPGDVSRIAALRTSLQGSFSQAKAMWESATKHTARDGSRYAVMRRRNSRWSQLQEELGRAFVELTQAIEKRQEEADRQLDGEFSSALQAVTSAQAADVVPRLPARFRRQIDVLRRLAVIDGSDSRASEAESEGERRGRSSCQS